jgi:Protein of unknown function (DUF3626).
MRKYNKLAIESIGQYAKKRVDETNESIQHVSNMSNIHSEEINQLKSNIQSNARIGIHFHPYRKSKDSKSVIEHLIESGHYKNQFETFDQLCEKYHLKLIWNRELEITVNKVPDNFRGVEMPIIAKEIAINNKINAYSIAKAETKLSAASKNESEVKKKNQLLKYLWHTLVKYGEPID